jgi:chromosome segregation ATPase
METLIVAGGVLLLADSNIALAFSALASLIGVGGLVALVTIGSTRRKAASQADLSDLEVDGLQQTLIKAVRENIDTELGRMRELVNEARTREASAIQGQAEAQLKLADAQRVLAEALEQASKERHDMRGTIGELQLENGLLRRKVEELERALASLRAELDAERHGRRRDDPAA